MDCIKFAKIDFRKTLSQMKVMAIFMAGAFLCGVWAEERYWSVIYLAFGGILMTTTPFFDEMLTERGFFILLPAKAESRMRGRYLFGSIFIFACCVYGAMVEWIVSLYKKSVLPHFIPIILMIFSSVLICNSIQFLVFTFLNVKNAQVLSLIRMIIPFVVFFIGNAISNQAIHNPKEMVYVFTDFFQYTEQHIIFMAFVFLGVSMLITILCCEICAWREAKKER